ncbi:MAG TPA: SRPBCC family protein [Usitatibacter sp.]|nr:SRPBCC family protein [Usitatibacter sp.]
MSEYAVVTAADTVRLERTLPGPIERVWAYLTEPDKRALWFAGGPMELRPGGSAELRFHNNKLTPGDDKPAGKYEKYGGEMAMKSRVTVCEPPQLLAYTFGGDDGSSSEVRFELTRRGDKVHLLLTHTRLKDREGMLSVSGGWHAHLDILVALMEARDPPKFWRSHAKLEQEYERRIP